MDSLSVDLYMDLFSVGVDQGFIFFLSNLDQHLDGIDVAEFIIVSIWDLFTDDIVEYRWYFVDVEYWCRLF